MLWKNSLLTVSMILICGVTTLSASADDAAKVRKELQALYNRSSAAISRKDIMGATAIDTPDYVSTDDKGKQHTLAENQKRATQLFKRPQIVKATAQVDRVTMQGKNAVADVTQHLYMKYTGPKTHYVQVLDQWSRTRDIWVKQGATWQRTRGQSLSVRVTMNGKMVYQSAAH